MVDGVFALDAATWGVREDHRAGLQALVASPLIVMMVMRFLAVARVLGIPGLGRIAGRLRDAPVTLRAVSWLMLTSAIVHLALAPHHSQEGEAGFAWLFGLDSAALGLGALLAARSRRWRVAAMLLLLANLVVYLGVTGKQPEEIDQLGIATKTVELLALGFLLYPHRTLLETPVRRRRWVGATLGFLFCFTLTGSVLWGVMLNAGQADAATDSGHRQNGEATATNHHTDDPTMVLIGDTRTPPTEEQIAAAAKLAADTRAAIAKYQDLTVALAAGYKPDGAALDFAVHYANKRYEDDDRILDPNRPETLVYSDRRLGPPVLLGVMYALPDFERDAPQPGGSLTVWHLHTKICFGIAPPHFIGISTLR